VRIQKEQRDSESVSVTKVARKQAGTVARSIERPLTMVAMWCGVVIV